MHVVPQEVKKSVFGQKDYGTLAEISCACPGLKTGTKYYFKVRAYVEVNGTKYYSAFGAVVSAVPKA